MPSLLGPSWSLLYEGVDQRGNNTVDNWLRTIDDLKNSGGADMGGFPHVLQMVVYDENRKRRYGWSA